MPHSIPTSPAMDPRPGLSSGRRHHRSYTIPGHYGSTTFFNEREPRELISFSALRKQHGSSDFNLHRNSSGDDSDQGSLPPLVLKQKPPSFSFDVTALRNTALGGLPAPSQIPFPQASPDHSPIHDGPLPTYQSVPPSISQAHSHSSSTPLKSSLKSSQSDERQIHQSSRQARSQSAPTIPYPGMLSNDQEEGNGPALGHMTPTTPKKVHFADSLASIRVFHKSARPASVSLPLGLNSSNDTEDSESSSSQVDYLRWNSWSTSLGGSHETRNIQSAAATFETVPLFEIDLTTSSPIPLDFTSKVSNRNIIMESLTLEGGADSSVDGRGIDDNLRLDGTILVRNISFEKQVVVRFTFDDWATASEVKALWSMHIQTLPSGIARERHGESPVEDMRRDERGWDRFSFRIKLSQYARTLDSKTLFLAGQFQAEGNRAWWDNNSGSNSVVRFKRTGQ
ncbi:putative phosphatase regulatory subunit-domain-containing protein [Flagelloscypha sp. PMI_526]|nr:putative phosphatase regulatory subunit-domain-containing protein [Flagelloscypha sp. PMI_526]